MSDPANENSATPNLAELSPLTLVGKLLKQPIILIGLVVIVVASIGVIFLVTRGGSTNALSPYNCHKSWNFDGQPTLKLGDDDKDHSRKCVHELQYWLNKSAVTRDKKLDENGVYDHRTSVAVREFQRTHTMNPDSQMGPKMWSKLRK